MQASGLSLDERRNLLDRFLARYTRRGFLSVTRTPTTAELNKPARFPEFLFKNQTVFVDIDERGWIYVTKTRDG